MLSHERIWTLIDALAARNGLSVSGLAKRAGLDPTTFNKSKRVAGDGRLRWPSTESLAKILEATKTDLVDFYRIDGLERKGSGPPPIPADPPVPLPVADALGPIGFEDAPDERAWFPVEPGTSVLVVQVPAAASGLFPAGGRLVVAADAPVDLQGARVYFRLLDGTVGAGEVRAIAKAPDGLEVWTGTANLHIRRDQVQFLARILWASQ